MKKKILLSLLCGVMVLGITTGCGNKENNNGDNNWLSMGMLATKNNPNDIKVNIRNVFETIPDNVTEEDF